MTKKNQTVEFEDYRFCHFAVAISTDVSRVPCAVCWQEPKDPGESLEIFVRGEWRVICETCANHHAEYLTEQLIANRVAQVRDMESLYAIVYEMDALKERIGLDEEKEESPEESGELD